VTRPERRTRNRVQLTRAVIARYGATPALILDITDAGARIEHFVRLDVGRRARFRLEWRDKTVEVEATVVRCRVNRFAAGDHATTVYESGLVFNDYVDDAAGALRDFVTAQVTRSLAEQLANARGIRPPRGLPDSEVVAGRGYVRCTLNGNRWDRKWTHKPDQPADGFTVLASEPADNVEQLCQQYARSSAEDRDFIKTLAKVSVERHPA
jgi:hypothetical protein